MAEYVEVDDFALGDEQLDEIVSAVETEVAAREALVEALGWDWEPAPGVPSVDEVAAEVLEDLHTLGYMLVPVPTDREDTDRD